MTQSRLESIAARGVMISSPCDKCGKDASYYDVFRGQKLKCKNCPDGWVTLPAKEGFVPLAQHVVATAPPVPVPVPPSATWRRSEPTTDAEREILRRSEAAASQPYEDPSGGFQTMRSAFFVIACLGFGSLVLRVFGVQFRIMNGMESAQPYAGFTVGCIGLALLFWWQKRYGD